VDEVGLLSFLKSEPILVKTLLTSIVAAGLLASVAGCSKSYIPNTDVENTSANRKIIAFCEDYRHAVEDKDVGKLLSMASPRYFEDGGNTNPEDDMDYDGLKDSLTSTFVKTQTIRYEIRYRKVAVNENKRVFVEYTYSASYRIPGLKGEEWKHTVADNRLELVPEGEGYKILAGM
jgi:hypothetical protein